MFTTQRSTKARNDIIIIAVVKERCSSTLRRALSRFYNGNNITLRDGGRLPDWVNYILPLIFITPLSENIINCFVGFVNEEDSYILLRIFISI